MITNVSRYRGVFYLQYDVINHGKDGIGAVSSSGQGSLWRLEALKGQQPDGNVVDDPKDLSLVGKRLGFRSEMLIEDTHTSVELFRQVCLPFAHFDVFIVIHK